MKLSSAMTLRSRNESMAGFVTCAKRWRKKAWRGRGRSERTARGASSPIDQVGS